MSSFRIIKMTNMSPMHIGLGRDSYDVSAGTLHSDTLTAALASLRALMGKDGDILQFLESFALSSAFPYTGSTLFLPKPAGRLNVEVAGMEEKDYRKLLKKIDFVALPVWKELVNGGKVTINRGQLHGQYLVQVPDENFQPPMVDVITQRVAVPRVDGKNADPFAFEWTFFSKEAGLYCLLDADSDVADEVIALFTELGEQGIGSDRNVGGGHFDVEASGSMELPQVENANATMLLSMFMPKQQEMNSLDVESSRYQLMKRGGFISGASDDSLRHLRKNTVYMFAAGSVFHTVEPFAGKVVDLRPSWSDGNLHPVYRSGKALSIKIKTTWQ